MLLSLAYRSQQQVRWTPGDGWEPFPGALGPSLT
jgi:hypothetical protein